MMDDLMDFKIICIRIRATQSTLLKESASVVNFLRAHCSNNSGSSSGSSSSAAAAAGKGGEEEVEGGGDPEALRRRELIVKMLIWEKRAVKWYKQDATAYIRALAQRLDAPAAAAILSQSTDAAIGGQEELLPLPLLEAEAQALEDAMTKYPEGNVGGVPQVFLQYSATYALNLDEDGLEVVVDDAADAKEGGGVGRGEGRRRGRVGMVGVGRTVGNRRRGWWRSVLSCSMMIRWGWRGGCCIMVGGGCI